MRISDGVAIQPLFYPAQPLVPEKIYGHSDHRFQFNDREVS